MDAARTIPAREPPTTRLDFFRFRDNRPLMSMEQDPEREGHGEKSGGEDPVNHFIRVTVVPIPTSGVVPPPPSTFVQAPQNDKGARGQWWYVDVTCIAPL